MEGWETVETGKLVERKGGEIRERIKEKKKLTRGGFEMGSDWLARRI